MNARYQTDWVAAACGPLSVRMAQEPAEVQLLRDALNCGHALKAGRPVGHVLWQGIYERDRPEDRQGHAAERRVPRQTRRHQAAGRVMSGAPVKLNKAHPPDGFEIFARAISPFNLGMMPLWCRRDDSDFSIGLRLEKKHCNYQLFMHGGAVATLADMDMGLVHRRSGEPRVHTVTASMTVDYIGSAKVGEWVEGTAKVLKQGRRLYFSECLITVGKDVGEPKIIARGNASFMPMRGPEG